MNPEENFVFPEPGEISHKYGDIKGQPLYEKKKAPAKTDEPKEGGAVELEKKAA